MVVLKGDLSTLLCSVGTQCVTTSVSTPSVSTPNVLHPVSYTRHTCRYSVALSIQELVEIVGRSTGIALMAPPTDNEAAQNTINTLMSAVNKKQKVHTSCPRIFPSACAWSATRQQVLCSSKQCALRADLQVLG